MLKVFQLHILLLLICIALMRAQQQHTGIQLHPSWLYSMPWRPLILPTANPLPPLTGVSQLSPGYTGPQTFPPVPQDQQEQHQGLKQQPQQYNLQQQQQYQQLNQQQYQQQSQQQYQQLNQQQYQQLNQQQYPQPYLQQPVLVGLFTPQLQAHPLAAPPQAGHFTLPFRPSPFAGYTDDEEGDSVRGQGNGIQEQQPQQQLEEPPFHAYPYNKLAAERSEPPRGDGRVAPLGYVYLSPSNVYNLIKS
ncbi:alpha-protein kinase 1 [Drosophila rhopaloa]|uniref:Alpha-protein kinase 1 n=1 Tax=Drosophila rhopaloa TaxID=1041015 RepID=A0A6P4FBB6_DRORH|nr:alpha-protein kinase 1 [Drosophila rhopaloa]